MLTSTHFSLRSGLLLLLLASLQYLPAQTIIWEEDFETDGNGSRYTISSEFFDGKDDYFGRILGASELFEGVGGQAIDVIGNGGTSTQNGMYAGYNGSYFLAGEDTDDTGGTGSDGLDEKTFNVTGIDVSAATSLSFKGLFAAGNTNNCGENQYDEDDYIEVYYQLDGGGYVLAMAFNPDLECNIPNDVFNEPLYHDPNLDGDGGEGTLLNNSLTEFSFSIPDGSTLDLRVIVHMDSGNEEVAMDWFRVEGNTSQPFVCPTIAGVSVNSMGCDNAAFNIDVTGLANMTLADNGEANFGIELVAFTSATGNPYSGGTSLGTILNAGNGTATLNGATIATPGTYQIYAILSPAPNDVNCRPSAVGSITINASPNPSFTSPGDFCASAGIQTGLTGGSPPGGTYSGNGVTNTAGSFSFDPAGSGVVIGQNEVFYTVTNGQNCMETASAMIEVFAVPPAPVIADITVCPGDIATITPPPAGGGPVTIATEDFDGGGIGYTSTPEFNGGTSDHWGVTNGTNISNTNGAYSFQGGGNLFWAAEDTDDTGGHSGNGADEQTFSLNPVGIGGISNIQLALDVAAGNLVGGANGYDALDHLLVEYSTNINTAWMDGLCFNFDDADGAGPDVSNEPLHYDPNCDGDGGEGAQLTPTAQNFSFSIPNAETIDVGATSLFIRIRVFMDANQEEVAFDNIVITGVSSATQFKFYGSDPALGPAVLLSGPGASYDHPTSSTPGTESVFVVACGSPCDSQAEEVVINKVDANPTVTCSGSLSPVNVDMNCQANVPNVLGGVSVSDDCDSSPSLSQSPVSGTVVGPGITVITVTATDAGGNTSTCTYDLQVNDNTPPTAVCQNATVQLDASGNGSITAAMLDGGSSDNCGGTLTYSPTDYYFGCGTAGGTLPLSVTVIDGSGNQASCTAMVTTEDNVAPVAVCQDITVLLDATGNASITGADIDGGSSDACGIASLSASPNAFGCDDVGTNSSTLTVTDNNGNTSTCSASVTVEDNTPPVLTCLDVTVQLGLDGTANVSPPDVNGGATDNCGITSLSTSPSVFNCSQLGSNTVTFIVFDVNGNQSSCTSNATVEDTTPPMAVCNDFTLNLTSDGTTLLSASDIDNGSFSACGGVDLSVSPDAFDCDDVGNTETVTLTVTSQTNGESSTCTADVTITDTDQFCNQPPIALCQDITVNADGNCQGTAVAADFDNGSSDPDGDPITFSVSPMGPYSLGVTGVTLSVTDDKQATSTCSANVTVLDVTAPSITCPADITTGNDQGLCSAVVSFAATSSDNCPGTTVAYSQAPGTTFLLGTTTVTATATDGSGNQAACSFSVTVNDTEAPEVTCPTDITTGTDPGQCGADVFYSVTLNDNCPGVTLNVDPSGSFFAVGTTPVMATATDAAGNTASCSFNVTVNDTEDPVAVCQDITVELDAAGRAEITASDIDNGSTDNCGIVSSTINGGSLVVAFCSNVGGTNTLQLEVTDAAGNSDNCLADLEVQDNIRPSISCPADETISNDPGLCSAVYTVAQPTADDNCAVTVLRYRYRPVDENGNSIGSWSGWSMAATQTLDVGFWRIQWQAKDASGNQRRCSFIVTVEDTEAPVIACAGLNLTVPNDPGECEADVDLPVPGYSDNCAVVKVEFRYREVDENNSPLGPWTSWMDESEASGTFAVGRYRIRWRIFDEAGNSDACTRFLTVEDVEPPIITCTNHEVVFNGQEYIDLYVPDLATATDNCEVASVELSINRIFCDELGDQITVVATATDVNGLSSVCTSKVDVLGLPCGWSQQPDGVGCEDGNAVSYSVPLDEFTVNSTDCHNPVTPTSDEYAFGQYNLCGDGMITAQVTSITGSPNGWAGVTMRGSNDPQAMMVSLLTNLGSQHRTETRLSYGGGVTSGFSPSFNRHWLRIQRIGNNFRGFVSFNGLSWFTKFNIYVPMDQCIELGLIVNSSSASGDNAATFAHVSVVGDPIYETPPPVLPLQQLSQPDLHFSLYPNPSTGRVTIQVGDFLDQEGELEIMDVNGQRVRSVRSGVLEYATEEVDLTDLPAGMYFVRLRLEDGTMQTQRVILQPRP